MQSAGGNSAYYSGMTGNFAPSANPPNMAYNAADITQMSNFYKNKAQSGAAALTAPKPNPASTYFSGEFAKKKYSNTPNTTSYAAADIRQCADDGECGQFTRDNQCERDWRNCPDKDFNGVKYKLVVGPD